MRIFKTKAFCRWADGEGLSDDLLVNAVREIECGLIDAKLGGHVVKKRALSTVAEKAAESGRC